MKVTAVKIALFSVVCFVVVVAILLGFAMLFDRTSVGASAESAVPADGIVGYNILHDSFYNLMYNSPYWRDSARTSTSLLSDSLLLYSTATSGGNFQYIYDFPLDDVPVVGNTYTLSIFSDGLLRSAVQSSLNDTDYTGTNIALDSLGSVVRLRYNSSFNRFVIQFVCNLSAQIHVVWVKFEIGNQFTGYVPNSYSNYGYDQGVSDGFSDGVDAVSRYNDGVVVAGDYVAPNSTNYPDVTLTDGQRGAGNFFYSGDGDATTVSTGLEIYSQSSASVVYRVANDWGTPSFYTSNTYFVAVLLRSNNGTSKTVSFTFGSHVDTYTFTSNNEVYFYLYKFTMPANTLPTNTLYMTFPSSSTFVLMRYEVLKSDYFQGFSASGDDYNNGYDTGYLAGVDFGFADGYADGYSAGDLHGSQEGYSLGSFEGYNRGYSAGVQTAEDGTWVNFVTAFIDVPVTTITSFLNFDVLGFNLLKLVNTVLAFILFFTLLKIIVGRVK